MAGQPPNLAPVDRLVGAAARAGLASLPHGAQGAGLRAPVPRTPVLPAGAPRRDPALLYALVADGPAGSFWAQRRSLRRLPHTQLAGLERVFRIAILDRRRSDGRIASKPALGALGRTIVALRAGHSGF